MNNQETSKDIKYLENLAEQILELKRKSRPRRPIVLEFCGSPKSGKSSCMSSLNIFLKRNGFKTQLITERADVCPIKNKFDFLFNVWTSCSAIAELSEYLSESARFIDVILADRAIFDAICWFEWQNSHDHLDDENYNSLINFLTMKKWLSTLDLIYVFTADPKVSLEREYATLLTRKYGSVMNPKVLGEFKEAIERVVNKYGSLFQKIECIDTSEMNQNKVSFHVTVKTLKILKEMIMEVIGYFELHHIAKLKSETFFRFDRLKDSNIKLKFIERDKVERNDKFIQPVPIMVFTNQEKNKFLVFKKKKESLSEKSPEKDRLLLYAGGHIRKEDNPTGINDDLLSLSKNAINREINEELGNSFWPKDNNPYCIWIKDNSVSRKHLAICFVVKVDFNNFRVKLHELEFIQKTGKSKSGRVLSIKEIMKERDSLDSWSRIILEKIFNIPVEENVLKFYQ